MSCQQKEANYRRQQKDILQEMLCQQIECKGKKTKSNAGFTALREVYPIALVRNWKFEKYSSLNKM